MRAKILEPTSENIAQAAQALAQNEVVALPTETVYGLGGCAFSPPALARIFETKERPTFDPLIVHVATSWGIRTIADLERLGLVDGSSLSSHAHETARRLIAQYWPGPLTLVLPKQGGVPDLATSGLPTVALRMPRHPVAQALLEKCGVPLAAPSANRFGRISPTTAQAVADELGDRIDYILDGGSCDIGLESTVLAMDLHGNCTILRPGGITRTEIERELGISMATANAPESALAATPMPAPGMLTSHYAPSKPFIILPKKMSGLETLQIEELLMKKGLKTPQKAALLLFSKPSEKELNTFSSFFSHPPEVALLSETADLREAAHRLFSEMRRLDQSNVEVIFSEPCPSNEGLGHAISDRMQRAAASKSAGRPSND